MSNNMIMAGMAYRSSLVAKNIVPYHHKRAAGGYRDYTTNPVPKNDVKKYQIDRAINKPGKLEPRTQAPTGPRSDSTKKDSVDKVKENETGTTSNTKNLMIIGGILLAAGIVYYYYK